MTKYKSFISIDEIEFIWIIVDDGKILSKNPSIEELNKVSKIGLRYNETNICHICREENDITDRSILYPRNVRREKDKDGNETGRYVCPKHYFRTDPNSHINAMKSVRSCRTGNQNPLHTSTRGDRDIELACRLYDYENLNKTKDRYNTDIDCRSNKTGLYHQIRGRCYNSKHGFWSLGAFDNEWEKEYEDIVCFCKSVDGKRIERIYRFPQPVIKGMRSISIVKISSRGISWYEKYRIKDDEEIKKANEIWKKITNRRNRT